MSKNIEEKIILISGGSDGLGLATASKLSKNHTVIILSPTKTKCEEAVKYYGVDDYVIADVTKEKQLDLVVKKIIKKYGRIDILINSAGILIDGDLDKNDPLLIEKALKVNTLGTILLSQKVIPFMKRVRSGRIINIISQAGLIPKAGRSVYRATKYAVKGFTDSLVLEMAPHNISVSAFYPDKMNTDFFKKGGTKIDIKKQIDLEEAVRCLEFLVNTSLNLNIPVLSLKKLNQY